MDVIFRNFLVRTSTIAILIGSLCLARGAYAVEVHSQSSSFSGNATPTKYIITVSKIEFHKSGNADDVFTTFVNRTADWDIASVSAGGSIGTMAATTTLSPGTYDKVRFTVSKTMTIQGSITNLGDGSPCRTDSDANTVLDPLGDGSVSKVYLGVRDGGASEPETMTIPSGSRAKASADFTDLGDSFRGAIAISFTVTGATPNIKMKFDVTNAMIFIRLQDNRCIVFPGPPSMSIEVT